MRRILLIDNYDSFTHNLAHLIQDVSGSEPIIVKNDAAGLPHFDDLSISAVVISPGPGHPADVSAVGLSRAALEQTELPVLGVCLGHQAIAHAFGGAVSHANEVVHGKVGKVRHNGDELFRGIPAEFRVVRYHSLAVQQPLPAGLTALAWSHDGTIMALKADDRPLWGVQFHPESIETEYGAELVRNFLGLAADSRDGQAPSALLGADATVVSVRVDCAAAPVAIFDALFAGSERSFWLDSATATRRTGRFSFMGDGSGPLASEISYSVRDQVVTIDDGTGTREVPGTLWDFLNADVASRKLRQADVPFEFGPGYVGYFGYELKADCGADAAYTADTPDALLLFVDRFVAIDHAENTVYVCWISDSTVSQENETWGARTAAALEMLAGASEADGTSATDGLPVNAGGVTPTLRHSRGTYLGLIGRVKEYLRAGDSYEVCLTNMAQTPTPTDPIELYRALRAVNPAPYAAYLKVPRLAVLSSSPELFLRVASGGAVESRPIKGTRPRGATRAEDEALIDDLRHSEKDRAENLMIVDLIRNDLGVVCEYGSVTVPELFSVETYANVHQLVSGVTGRLRPSLSAIDCLRACFPGGSMTGAPKIRTMQIIDELESGPRGVYSGALGYVALSGSAELNIVIRTLVARDGVVSYGIGGAIVWDSDPEDEFQETMVKSRGPLAAIAETNRRIPVALEGKENHHDHTQRRPAPAGSSSRD